METMQRGFMVTNSNVVIVSFTRLDNRENDEKRRPTMKQTLKEVHAA